jgi:hypothetical protein
LSKVRIADPNNTVLADVDNFSGHFIAMGEIHAHIHKGQFFTLDLVDEALADDGILGFRIATGAETPAVHMRSIARTGGAARFTIYEGTTFTDNGSEGTPLNRNRISSNTFQSTVTTGPTADSLGTAIYDIIIPGTTGFFSSGGGVTGSFEEFILARGESYYIRLQNLAGGARIASLQLDMYEIT